ncbi:MAG TPA: SpoIIE family protein phosphatase [Candidatus Ozemobacteraceae bacterium]|nr:SpoIIE family protein phosphatase [Candidatus Ozemobacteraceae bacterium]
MRLAWVCLLLALHFVEAYAIGVRMADETQERKLAAAHALLRRIGQASNDAKYLGHLCVSLKKRIIGSNAATAPFEPRYRQIVSRLAAVNGKIWLFDGSGRLVSGVASDPVLMERMFAALRTPWMKSYDMNESMFPGGRKMLDDVSWIDLTARPDRIVQLNKRSMACWGYWFWRDAVAPASIAGMLAIAEMKSIENDAVLGWIDADLRRAGIRIGWFDRLKPERSRLLSGLSVKTVKRFERDFFSRGEDAFRANGRYVAVGSFRERMLLLRVVPVIVPRLPPVSWVILMLWIVPCIRWLCFATGRAPALSSLLLVVIGVAGVLPFCLSVVFWRHFSESRTRAVTASIRQELEQRLVRIDQKLPALMERLATRYRLWRARFEAEFARDDRGPMVPVSSNHGIEIRRFATDTPKFRLLEETKDWEENGTVDTVFLVDRNGLYWRENSDSRMLLRRMARWPKQRMLHTLESLYRRHGDSPQGEFHWLLSLPETGCPREKYLGDYIFGRGTAARLASQLIRAAIGQYNIWKNIPSGPDGREDLTTLVTTGMSGSTFGGGVVSLMLSNLGNFTVTSNEDGALITYLDVIRGISGAAVAGFGVYHHSCSLAAQFFDELLSAWPDQKDGMRLYAVSDRSFTLAYPGLDDDLKFSKLFRRLEPPNVLRSDIVRFEGKPAIMAALNCRQVWSYYLVGVLPWDLVQERVRSLHVRLIAVAAGMSLILIVLCLRVWQGVIRPVSLLMAGVDAMEARRLDHRISIATGDELEHLADTFNDTLAGMEELEVAKIVQQKLLPAGEVSTAAWAYRGVSEMSSEVGGDYHDARVCADGSVVFMLGDVSGHGVSAALVVAMAKAAFGNLVRSGTTEPGALLEQMNAVLLSTTRKLKMMTALAGLMKPDGTLLLANAGHCYPAILRRKGGVEYILREGSFPLGVRKRGIWPAMSVALEPGDRLLLYTDGIPEAVDRNGQQLDYERWHRIMDEEAVEVDAMGLISRLHRRLRDFTHPVRWGDDVTIAVITRLEPQKQKGNT